MNNKKNAHWSRAAARAERHSYATSMAAVVKSLTSAEPATALEIAEVKAAEAASRAAIKALEAKAKANGSWPAPPPAAGSRRARPYRAGGY